MDRDNFGRRNQAGVPSFDFSGQNAVPRGHSGPQMIQFSVPTGRSAPQGAQGGGQGGNAGRQPVQKPAARQKGTGQPARRNRRAAQPRKKSLGDRVGLQKKSGQAPPRQGRPNGRRTAAGAGRVNGGNGETYRPSQPAPVQNPQQAGYRQGTPRPPRRMTRNEKKRMELRRRLLGLAAVMAALAMGVVLSINLLFKVTEFRVENVDHSTPANTSIYTEEQIVGLLGIQKGDNLFGFSTAEKTRELTTQLPYFDTVKVETSLPGTVVVRVKPATERYYLQLDGGQWVVLSEQLKALKLTDTQPDGLTWLDAKIESGAPQPGDFITLQGNNTALPQAEAENGAANAATAESAANDANEALFALRDSMATYGILNDVSLISMTDLSEISFLYQGRVSVRLGTVNSMDYKMHLASNALLDADGTGIGATERGTLDVSYQQSDGEIRGYFQLAEADSGGD